MILVVLSLLAVILVVLAVTGGKMPAFLRRSPGTTTTDGEAPAAQAATDTTSPIVVLVALAVASALIYMLYSYNTAPQAETRWKPAVEKIPSYDTLCIVKDILIPADEKRIFKRNMKRHHGGTILVEPKSFAIPGLSFEISKDSNSIIFHNINTSGTIRRRSCVVVEEYYTK